MLYCSGYVPVTLIVTSPFYLWLMCGYVRAQKPTLSWSGKVYVWAWNTTFGDTILARDVINIYVCIYVWWHYPHTTCRDFLI